MRVALPVVLVVLAVALGALAGCAQATAGGTDATATATEQATAAPDHWAEGALALPEGDAELSASSAGFVPEERSVVAYATLTNLDPAGVNAQFRLTARAADGRGLGSGYGSTYIDGDGSMQVAAAIDIGADEAVARVEVASSASRAVDGPAPGTSMSVSDAVLLVDRSPAEVSGQITATFIDWYAAQVRAVCTDASGAAVAAGLVDVFPPTTGQRVPFTIDLTAVGLPAQCTVTASPSEFPHND